MRTLTLLFLLLAASVLRSQVVVSENAGRSKNTFPLVSAKEKAAVVYDANDYLVVQKTAGLFVDDVENVTGQKLLLTDEVKKEKVIILVGTIEKNRLIRQLAEKGKLTSPHWKVHGNAI